MNRLNKARGVNVLLLALLAALALPGAVRAEEEAGIADHMDTINSAVKKLRKDVKKADLNKASAEIAKKASEAAAKCLALVPEIAKSVPAAERDKFIAEYKEQMAALVATFKTLETTLNENKNEEAEKLVQKLLDQKKKGHEKFVE